MKKDAHLGEKDESFVDGKTNSMTAERLTGKQRCLRGGKVFLWTFVAVGVLFALNADVVPDRDTWGWQAAFGCTLGAWVALVAGLVVAAFPSRRWWHWIFAMGVGVLAAVLA